MGPKGLEKARQKFQQRVNEYTEIANRFYGSTIDPPKVEISFFKNHRERRVGAFYNNWHKKIVMNEAYLCKENWNDLYGNTILHELAHHVEYIRWGFKRSTDGRQLAHGKRFREIMRDCFNVKPTTYHNMNHPLSAKKKYAAMDGYTRSRKVKRYKWKCFNCQRTTLLTLAKHKAALKHIDICMCGECHKLDMHYMGTVRVGKNTLGLS